MAETIVIWGNTRLADWLNAALSDFYSITHLKTASHEIPTPDLMIFAMPNHATAGALQELAGAGISVPPILSLQNGVGSVRRIDSLFGEGHAITGAVTVQFTENGMLQHQKGGFALQADHPASELAFRVLRRTGLPIKAGNADSIQWSSVFYELHANALSAILNVDPAEIYENPKWFSYEVQQLKEALFVIDAINVRLMPLPGVNIPQIARAVRWLPLPLLALYLSRIPHPDSLRYELAQGIKRSDAAYFNGAVAVQGHDMQHRTPLNHVLALTVTDIAEGRQRRDEFKKRPELLDTMIRLAH